ncbi:MAG: S8 family serine peptidase, partial [Sinomicrobium sp.]|nr:S8 family serine peptidase [Sinomicrobium sp.]
TFCIAAGNSGANANNYSPSRVSHNNVLVIAAIDSNDNWASFSNYGSNVDYAAPGVSIESTWKGAGYNTISGTSMASPHAAGVALMGNPSTDGSVSGPGGSYPIIHQ